MIVISEDELEQWVVCCFNKFGQTCLLRWTRTELDGCLYCDGENPPWKGVVCRRLMWISTMRWRRSKFWRWKQFYTLVEELRHTLYGHEIPPARTCWEHELVTTLCRPRPTCRERLTISLVIGKCNSENLQSCRPVYTAQKGRRWMDLSRFLFRICEYDFGGLEHKIVIW